MAGFLNRTSTDPTLNDYYTTTGKYEVLELDRQEAAENLNRLSEENRALLQSGKQYYEITFRNLGGLVMPLIVEFEYEDGEREVRRIPAEIWKMSEPTVTKVFVTDRPAVRITLDPYMETADVDMGNNVWPPRPEPPDLKYSKAMVTEDMVGAEKTPCNVPSVTLTSKIKSHLIGGWFDGTS